MMNVATIFRQVFLCRAQTGTNFRALSPLSNVFSPFNGTLGLLHNSDLGYSRLWIYIMVSPIFLTRAFDSKVTPGS